MLQFFSASTSIVDSKRAMAECLENALAGESSLDCDLLIFYTGMGHNFKDLLSEARRLSLGAQVVGCTGAGVIGKEGPNESLKSLAIMAIKGPRSEFVVTGTDSSSEKDAFDIGKDLASSLKAVNPAINLILFNPSAHISPSTSLIDGIKSVFGPNIPITGGASFDNMKLISNFQFLNEQIFEKGAIMVGFADPTIELVSMASHGFDILDNPFTVTKSDKIIVHELNGKPAWKAWTERLGMPVTAVSEVLVFAPLALELPEELHDEYNNKYIISGGGPLPDGRSIQSLVECPVGTKVYMTRRNEDHIKDGLERMMVQILDRCQGRKPVAVFHADCAARGNLLFNRIMKEEITSQMQFPLSKGENLPWLGIYGAYEITPLKGISRIHQYTTSLYVIVRRKPVAKDVEISSGTVKDSSMFEKTCIRNIEFKNRFVYSATWQGKANFDGSASSLLISSLIPVARNEIGLIIGEMAYITSNAISSPGQLGIYDDKLIPGLRRLTDFVHKEGVQIVSQLVHPGLFASPLLSGCTPKGPSVLRTSDGEIGKEMTKAEISETIIAFGDAALRAKEAGFDGIQIHAAHGWLLSQFLSPFFNKRTDEYGGSMENRARIVVEAAKSIRESVGENFAVMVKINSDDFLPGGFNIEEMLQVSVMLEKAGVDAIEISGGTIGALMSGNPDSSFSPVSKKGIYYKEAARRLKERVKIPVILVGGIRTFETAEEIVKSGVADYISLCRPLIREPDLIKRWKSGNLKKSDCISESACFQPGIEGKGVHCVHVK
jgi:2,4-dienoyl-CoA reductase-like NADH-dependent reductase (Old Yellow Enzyme family)